MKCPYSVPVPNKFDFIGRQVYRPCGQCAVCRKNKVMSLTARANYEYKKSNYNALIGLTYDDNHLFYNHCLGMKPIGYPSLHREHLQKFIDDLRHFLKRHKVKNCPSDFKYLACGEYGGRFARPHYHIALIGLDFASLRKVLPKVWQYGFVDIKPLESGGLRYVIKYFSKGVNGRLADLQYTDNGLDKPFVCFSKGFGSGLYKDNIDSINKYGAIRYGTKFISVPPYYRDKYISYDLDNLKNIFYRKEKNEYANSNNRFGLSRSEFELKRAKTYIRNELKKSIDKRSSVDILELQGV